MAKYSTDFSEYTAGVAPADWTNRWHSGGGFTVEDTGDSFRVLQLITGASDGRLLWSWDDLDSDINSNNIEVVSVWRAVGGAPSADSFWPCRVQGSGNSTSETAYSASLGGTQSLARPHLYNNASSSFLGPGTSFVPELDTFYRVTFTANAGTQTLKVATEEDPSTLLVDLTTNDSTLSATGLVGVGAFAAGTTQQWSFFSVGTAGEAADLPVGTINIRKGSQFTVEETLAGNVVSATLNGNAITVDSHVGTTVTLTDTGSGVTASGAYDLVLTDDSATPQNETISVQVNVYGIVPSNNPLRVQGAAQSNLTSVQIRVTDGASIDATQLYYTGAGTTDANGNLSNIDLNSTSVVADDLVLMHVKTAGGESIIATETVGTI